MHLLIYLLCRRYYRVVNVNCAYSLLHHLCTQLISTQIAHTNVSISFSLFHVIFFFVLVLFASLYSNAIAANAKKTTTNYRYTAAHTLDLYSEVASICRPPLALTGSEMGSFKKSQTPSTGYIISVFKVFEGDDGERFEKNWLYWTGARMLYR